MSTHEYLSTLNYEQLWHARTLCDKLIDAKEAEAKVGVWVVSSDNQNLKFFQEDEYLVAAEFLLNKARENVATQIPRRSPGFMGLSLAYERLRESEWRDLFPNNERGGV